MPNDRYQIIDQEWRSWFDPSGGNRDFVIVRFETLRTNPPVQSDITVARADYTADNVARLIAPVVDQIEAVSQL